MSVKLDSNKLLGFRIVKGGTKIGVKIGTKVGVKVR